MRFGYHYQSLEEKRNVIGLEFHARNSIFRKRDDGNNDFSKPAIRIPNARKWNVDNEKCTGNGTNNGWTFSKTERSREHTHNKIYRKVIFTYVCSKVILNHSNQLERVRKHT